MGVAQNEGPPGANVVDVLVAIGVPDVGATAPDDKEGFPAYVLEGANGAVDAAREVLLRFFVQFARRRISEHYVKPFIL